MNAAIAAGYSTLSFDRLGTGLSTHGEPRNEIQAPLEVNLLHELTCMLRHGKLPSAPKYKPKKVIHVGHSYGSCQTYALSNAYPTDTNGIVLTGFAFNATFLPLFLAGGDFQQARERYPDRFGKLPAGYLISGSAGADQYNFLQQDRVDPKLAEMGEKTKQPVTIGQLLTVANLPMVSKFKGPVMVIIGGMFFLIQMVTFKLIESRN